MKSMCCTVDALCGVGIHGHYSGVKHANQQSCTANSGPYVGHVILLPRAWLCRGSALAGHLSQTREGLCLMSGVRKQGFGKQGPCILAIFVIFRSLRQAPLVFCGHNAHASFSPFSSKPPLFGRGKNPVCQKPRLCPPDDGVLLTFFKNKEINDKQTRILDASLV